MKNYSESTLTEKLLDLQKRIRTWAKKEDIWGDSGFKSYIDHFDDEPKEVPVVLILFAKGDLGSVFNGYNSTLEAEFDDVVDSTEFCYELYNYTTVFFYAKHEELKKAYKDYFEWKWICKLLEPDYSILYKELLEQLARNPEKINKLDQNKFDDLLNEILFSQGYKTELGKGWLNGNVNIRIYQNNEIDQVVTLVRVKRNKNSLPISLEIVQSCKSKIGDEKTNGEVFITTAKYLPRDRKFADRLYRRITLVDSINVKNWCKGTATMVVRDKSKLVTDSHIKQLISSNIKKGLEGAIVHGNSYYGCQTNHFCMVLKDTVNASLLMKIPKEKLIKPGEKSTGDCGQEVPVVDDRILQYRTSSNVFRAEKRIRFDGTPHFWGDGVGYYIWDGKPKSYDNYD